MYSTVSAAKVSAPKVSAPKVSAPKVSAPKVSAPKVSAPKVSAPKVSAPKLSAPKVSRAVSAAIVRDKWNELFVPKVSAPKVSAAVSTFMTSGAVSAAKVRDKWNELFGPSGKYGASGVDPFLRGELKKAEAMLKGEITYPAKGSTYSKDLLLKAEDILIKKVPRDVVYNSSGRRKLDDIPLIYFTELAMNHFGDKGLHPDKSADDLYTERENKFEMIPPPSGAQLPPLSGAQSGGRKRTRRQRGQQKQSRKYRARMQTRKN